MNDIDTDVLVVGAGPAGLTMAALLATYGVDAVTVTKYAGVAHSPRAHITNQRTMEVFRDLRIEEAVREVAVPNELMGNNVWATSFAGQEIARLLTWGSGPQRRADYEQASPSAMCNIPQHIMEPVLLRGALDAGADIRMSSEVVAIEQDEAGVRATVRNRESGETWQVRAKYVVGADGARSCVAEQLGFGFEGESGLGAAANVWLEADLTKYTDYRPGTLYWMAQPGNDYWVGSGTWICVKPWTEWVLLFMYDPAEGEPDLSEQACITRAQSTIGDPDVEVRIKSVSKWQINHVVATEYQRGRAFLIGDAAHRHPPANGLGTNTSVQDAFNLAWKLAAVTSGRAGKELLASYHDERRPVGKQVVDRAMQSVKDMAPISAALGFAPGQSADEGWATLDDLWAPGPDSEQRRRALTEAVDLQNYQFNCHGVELDRRYESGAVAGDGTPWPEPTRDPELYHHPTSHPGATIPHAWVERDRERVSTLDLTGKGRFTIVTGIGGEAWADAAVTAATRYGVDIDTVVIGPHAPYDDVLGQWARLREVEDTGALLVRPDQIVAWRAASLPADPETALDDALAQVLARTVQPAG